MNFGHPARARSRMLRALAMAIALGVAASGEAADVRNGQRLYTIHCASCHGPNGVPQMPGAPDLKRGAALMRADSQLLQVIKRGRGAMPGYFGLLDEREILDAIAYMRTFM